MVTKHVISAEDLIQVLEGNQVFETVHVRFNLQKVKPQLVRLLAERLQGSKSVVELEMSNCDIRADQAATLLAAIQANARIRKLK